MAGIFLSHSSKDKGFVRILAKDLATKGLSVWFDEWEMKIGDSLVEKISKGIKTCGWLIVVMSENSINSDWVNLELNTALVKQMNKKEIIILPILIEDCEIATLLSSIVYADFRNDYKVGLNSLIKTLIPDLIVSKLKPVACSQGEDLISYDEEPKSFNKILTPQRTIYVNEDFLFELEYKILNGDKLYDYNKQGYGIGFNFTSTNKMFGLAGQVFLFLINYRNCFCALATKENTDELDRIEGVSIKEVNRIIISKVDGILKCSINDYLVFNKKYEFPLDSCYPSVYLGGEQTLLIRNYMTFN